MISAGAIGRLVAFTGFALFYKGDGEGYFKSTIDQASSLNSSASTGGAGAAKPTN